MMRIDRFFSVTLFLLLRRVFPLSRTRVPILMYHGVSDETDETRNAYFRVTTSPKMFEQQMRLLAENGYYGCRLDAIADNGNNNLRKTVLTFDDGFADFYNEAWPILEKYGFSASVFLPTGFIEDHERSLIKGKQHLSWDQVRELHAKGIEFGSHSITHTILRNCPRDEIKREIVESKAVIEKRLRVPVRSFSYPYAFPFDDSSLVTFLDECVRSAGYEFAVSTRIGVDNVRGNRVFRPRLPINDLDDPKLFLAKIKGAYDWVNAFQYGYRFMKMTALRIRRKGMAS